MSILRSEQPKNLKIAGRGWRCLFCRKLQTSAAAPTVFFRKGNRGCLLRGKAAGAWGGLCTSIWRGGKEWVRIYIYSPIRLHGLHCPLRRVGLSAGLFPSNFVLTILYAFLFVYSCCVRRHSYRSDKYLWRDEVINLLVTHSSPVTSALSDPKLLPSTSPLLSVQACVYLLLTVRLIAGGGGKGGRGSHQLEFASYYFCYQLRNLRLFWRSLSFRRHVL